MPDLHICCLCALDWSVCFRVEGPDRSTREGPEMTMARLQSSACPARLM